MLLEHGHHGAFDYAVGDVWVEARLVRDRVRAALADQAVMMHTVIVGALSDAKHLKKFLRELTDGD